MQENLSKDYIKARVVNARKGLVKKPNNALFTKIIEKDLMAQLLCVEYEDCYHCYKV